MNQESKTAKKFLSFLVYLRSFDCDDFQLASTKITCINVGENVGWYRRIDNVNYICE